MSDQESIYRASYVYEAHADDVEYIKQYGTW
jgi:hypothetical protein